MTALGDFFRKPAATYRATAQERPDDPRHPRSAGALDDLADYADRAAAEALFQMRYLLGHHVADGELAWPGGQSGAHWHATARPADPGSDGARHVPAGSV